MTRPALSLIAAVARNGAIGKNNGLLWSDPDDQRHFRRTTMGSPVIMGRKTWDSLPARFRPLPGRRNIVLTRDPAWQSEGVDTAPSVQAVFACLDNVARAFVIGGADVYALTLPFADRLLLTEIDADLDGDVFFPPFDRSQFVALSRDFSTDASGRRYCFAVYENIAPRRNVP